MNYPQGARGAPPRSSLEINYPCFFMIASQYSIKCYKRLFMRIIQIISFSSRCCDSLSGYSFFFVDIEQTRVQRHAARAGDGVKSINLFALYFVLLSLITSYFYYSHFLYYSH